MRPLPEWTMHGLLRLLRDATTTLSSSFGIDNTAGNTVALPLVVHALEPLLQMILLFQTQKCLQQRLVSLFRSVTTTTERNEWSELLDLLIRFALLAQEQMRLEELAVVWGLLLQIAPVALQQPQQQNATTANGTDSNQSSSDTAETTPSSTMTTNEKDETASAKSSNTSAAMLLEVLDVAAHRLRMNCHLIPPLSLVDIVVSLQCGGWDVARNRYKKLPQSAALHMAQWDREELQTFFSDSSSSLSAQSIDNTEEESTNCDVVSRDVWTVKRKLQLLVEQNDVGLVWRVAVGSLTN